MARVHRTRHALEPMPVPGDRGPTVPIGAGDPATAIGGPAPFTAIVAPRYRRVRYGVIDAVVTLAIMIWLAASLATLATEWRSDGLPPAAMATAVKPTSSADPDVAVGPATEASAGRTTI